MNTYKRYFRVTSGPLMDAARAIEKERSEAAVAYKSMCQEVGAKGIHTYSDGRCAGFSFDSQPDLAMWKKPNRNGLYWPRKNTAEGKALYERAVALPKARNLSDAIEAVGLVPHFPVIFSDRSAWSCVATGSVRIGVMFVVVPWRDIDPQQLADYKQQKESPSRNSWNAELDHLLWEPTADMVEVKEWEVKREIEELNAKLKQKEAAPC